jgi:deoxyxylulose-5-phosphate synthase
MSAPPNVPLLDRVRELADLRNFSAEELQQIAAELRAGRRGRIRALRHLRIHS